MTDRKLVLKAVGPDAPGHLWRLRKWAEIQAKSKSVDFDTQIEALDGMVDFLLDRVEEPTDRDEARDLLAGPDGLSMTELQNLGSSVLGVNGTDPLA